MEKMIPLISCGFFCARVISFAMAADQQSTPATPGRGGWFYLSQPHLMVDDRIGI